MTGALLAVWAAVGRAVADALCGAARLTRCGTRADHALARLAEANTIHHLDDSRQTPARWPMPSPRSDPPRMSPDN